MKLAMNIVERIIGIAVAIVLVIATARAQAIPYGQDPQVIRQQAEAALNKMTPEEIDRKLKELGLTREEATKRARDFGVSLDDYLVRVISASPSGAASTDEGDRTSKTTMREVSPAVQKSVLAQDTVVRGINTRPGAIGLRLFGQEVFNGSTTVFEPTQAISTPPNYALGPGDELSITMWGETKLNIQLTVNRDGNLVVPDVGPVMANGLTVSQFRQKLLGRMSSVYSSLKNGAVDAGTFLDVSLGKLRTIQIFVLGDVIRPGSYAVSSMATVLNALYLAGGPGTMGSLRDVRVMREGKMAASVDVYAFLLRGEKPTDARLQDGDVVFVPPAGIRVALNGSVLRPAIYEMLPQEGLGRLVTMAGGLYFDADHRRIHIQRTIPFAERAQHDKNILGIDLNFASLGEVLASRTRLADGDIVSVYRVRQIPENVVFLRGNVNREGPMELREGMRISDAVREADSLKRSTFMERATLFRLQPNLRRELLWFSPRLALEGDPRHDLLLKNEDELEFYPEDVFRPQHSVSISGAVRRPGTYPRLEGATVADLVVMAGGLTEDASLTDWELAHIDTAEVGTLSSISKINSTSAYWNSDSARGYPLRDFDHLNVPTDPRRGALYTVMISGSVMFPGSYAIRRNDERIAEMIRRAGGLKPDAYLEGTRFYRKRNNAGLVSVDFRKILSDESSTDNIKLVEGDSIFVANLENVVYVRGEVYAPAAVTYQRGAGLDYYLTQAGGANRKADESNVFVSLPNGRKWEPRWFFLPDPEILPGSTITVPRQEEVKDNTLEILRDTVGIVASLAAITVALVQITK